MSRPTIVTADGVRLAGRRWLSPATPGASVVLVHGFSASADCPQVDALGALLHADGLDVVSYSARGHTGSDGESTLGDHERHDVEAAVALARQRSPRVVLVGASMGAIAALRYAVGDPELAGLVLVSCPARWRLPRNAHGLLAAAMTRTPVGRRLTTRLSGVRVAAHWTNPAPPIDLVGLLRVPVTFVHGTADRFIAPADASVLHDSAPEPRRRVIVPGMGHAFDVASFEPVRQEVRRVLALQPQP